MPSPLSPVPHAVPQAAPAAPAPIRAPTPAPALAPTLTPVVARAFTRARALATPLALALLALAAPTPDLHAQQSAGARPTPASDTLRSGLASDTVLQVAPLVVDVLRAPLAGAALPFSVAAADLDRLPQTPGGAFLSDALIALPGLQLQNRHNFAVGERVVVRGFGARAQFGVRGLRAVLDGIPATLPDGQTTLDHVDPSALGRVELLRGPGSAWWGNAAGGVLFMRSREPAAGRHTRATLRAGAFGRLETSVVVEDGGKAPGDATTRLGITGVSWDGFRANPLSGGTYGAADRWIVTGRHRRELGSGELTLSLAALDLDAENPGSLPLDSLFDPDRSAWANNVRQNLGKTVRQAQLGAAWTGPIGASTGAAGPLQADLAAWVITRDLRNPIPGTVVEVDRAAGGLRAALRREEAAFDWALGAEVEMQRDDRRNFVNELGANGAQTLGQLETVLGTALFARAGAALGPALLQGAVRLDRIEFEADDRWIAADERDESGSRALTALSPSFGVRVPGRLVDLFGSVAAFMETPTTTELANRPDGAGGFNPELEPTRGWTFEAGAAGTLGARLGWEFVAFRTRLRDELVPFEVASDPGRTYYRNAAESSHDGFEWTVRAVLPQGLEVRSSWTRVDARFGEGPEADLEGLRIPGRAPNRLETRLTRGIGTLRGALDVVWSDAVPTNDRNTGEAPSWLRVDLRVGPGPVAFGRWQIEPWAEVGNVFDERYVGSVVVNAFGGRWFEPAPGRNLTIGAQLSFGGSR